jgi:hypothetical protein
MPDYTNLRRPSRLEALFYQELLAPLRHFTHSCEDNPSLTREVNMMTQRFKKDIARYGYMLTDLGPMMIVEKDIIYARLDPAVQVDVASDMDILRRLRFR